MTLLPLEKCTNVPVTRVFLRLNCTFFTSNWGTDWAKFTKLALLEHIWAVKAAFLGNKTSFQQDQFKNIEKSDEAKGLERVISLL